MIIAFYIAIVMLSGIFVGFGLALWLYLRQVRPVLIALKNAAEIERKRAIDTEEWAAGTIQNIVDAAADYGFELALDGKPIGPRPEAKEWPAVIGEQK